MAHVIYSVSEAYMWNSFFTSSKHVKLFSCVFSHFLEVFVI